MRRLALVCLVAAGLAACDRVPLAPVGTDLLVSGIDFDVVFLQPDLVVRFQPAGPSGPLQLRIRNKDIDFDSTAGVFVYEKTLELGLNVYPYTVTDLDGTVVRDTLFAVYLPLQRTALVSPDGGVARAGAARSALSLGRTLVSGGANEAGAGLASASVLQASGPFIGSEEIALLRGRVGHTATPVAGGTLLLGGARTSTPSSAADFVREPEFVDESGATRPVAVASDAFPARSGHLAKAVVVGGQTYLTLIGGRTPGTSGVVSSTSIDVYRVVTEGGLRLERLTPGTGAGSLPVLIGAALAETGAQRAVVTGIQEGQGLTLELEWVPIASGALPFSLRLTEVPAPRRPRTGADFLFLPNGLALLTGGLDASGDPVGTLEVYVPGARRTFRFPAEIGLAVPRSGHIATIFAGSRIVVSGGRAATGGPIVAREAFDY